MRHRNSEPGTSTKTWGPFTGRQLTTILCVLIVTVLFPVTAHAVVSGTSVFVTDKATGKTAAVDANRNLQTKVNGSVTITGTAPGNVAPTSAFVQSRTLALGTSAGAVLTPSAGRELIVTGAHVDWNSGNAAVDYYASLSVGDAGTCANVSSEIVFWDLPNAQDTHDTPFSPGFIVPAGKAACAQKSSITPGVFITLFGYTVPAGSVAAPAAALGAGAHVARH